MNYSHEPHQKQRRFVTLCDILNEAQNRTGRDRLMPISQAARHVPVSAIALRHYATHGLTGVKLSSQRIGNQLFISLADLQQFGAAVSDRLAAGQPWVPRQRRRQNTKNERNNKATGANGGFSQFPLSKEKTP